MENKKIELNEITLNNLELKELLDLYNKIKEFSTYLNNSVLDNGDNNE